MTIAGVAAVVSVERRKIQAQWKARIALLLCAIGPFAFAVAMRVQTSLPTDTVFGRAANESGFAIPLVVLGFASLWALPVLTGIVGGDIFAAEDRYGTWGTVLTRSRSRAEVFVGKLITAVGFSTLATLILAGNSIAAGVLLIGVRPLIDLSGVLLAPAEAARSVALAWATVLPSALAFTAAAALASVATRSSAAGIGLPVVAGLIMQLVAFVDAPEAVRRLLLTSGFGAWHGILSHPRFYGPLMATVWVSAAYIAVSLWLAYRLLMRRDIGR